MSGRKVKELFDRRAASFEDYSNWCKDEELYRRCIDPLQDMLLSIKCLDLGGGTGWIARRNAFEAGRNWTVLDVAPRMGEKVGSPVRFVEGDAHHLPFEDREFGHIVIRSLLHYVDAPKVLSEARRVLSSRGHLVVLQKVISADNANRTWHGELFALRNPTGSYLWYTAALTSVVKQAGFRVLSVSHVPERRKINLERWISKDGTVPTERREKIRQMIQSPPPEVISETKQVIKDGILEFDRQWAVIYARRETANAQFTPAVFSVIVEREIDGIWQVLMQKRRKKYEEPEYYNSWELPQGKLEKGVSALDSIRDELQGETGLILCEILTPSKVVEFSDPGFTDLVDIVYPLTVVRTRLGTDFIALAVVVSASGVARSIDIDREHTWFTCEGLRKILNTDKVYPLNRPMLTAYIGNREKH